MASASQDIVLDAYRIESFNSKEQAPASPSLFWAIVSVGFFRCRCHLVASAMDWNDVYKIKWRLARLVGRLAVLCSREPGQKRKKSRNMLYRHLSQTRQKISAYRRLRSVQGFTRRADWALILLFIFLYRMSDAYMGPMAYPFYDDMDQQG